MKSLTKFLVFVSLISVSAIAMEDSEIPRVDPSSQTCQEMQQILVINKIINVKYSLGDRVHVYSEDYCPMGKMVYPAYVSTKETTFCLLGYVCVKRP